MRNFLMLTAGIRTYRGMLCITLDLLHRAERSAETGRQRPQQKKTIAFAPHWRHRLVSS